MLNSTAAPWRPLQKPVLPGGSSTIGSSSDDHEGGEEEEEEQKNELVIYPIRPSSTAGFADSSHSSPPSLGLLDWPTRRPVRTDGRGGLEEFFVPGSPTFVRAARPAVLALATVAGLAVLAAVLAV